MFDLRVRLACGKRDRLNQLVISAEIGMLFLDPPSVESSYNELCQSRPREEKHNLFFLLFLFEFVVVV